MGIYLKNYERLIAGMERGETCRVNHDGCPAGMDTKERLYLTRPAASPNMVLAYCHNCQGSAVLSEKHEKYRDYREHDDPVSTPTLFNVPHSLEYSVDRWPTIAQKWRIEKGFTEEQCVDLRIAYDTATHRIYLPQYERVAHRMASGNLLGYQLRLLEGRGAKYLTASANGESPSTVFHIKTSGVSVVDLAFIVEDLASGNALANTLWYLEIPSKVLVNYGVKVTPKVIQRVKNFRQGVVWLDNDGEQIRYQAEQITKVWSMLSGQRCATETHLSDPKSESGPIRIECVLKWRQT